MFEAGHSPDRAAQSIGSTAKKPQQKKASAASAYKSLMPRNNNFLEPVMQSRQKNTASKAKAVRPGRSTLDAGGDPMLGPGSHDPRGQGFGDNAKGFTIGVKRESRLESSPGPGEYDAGRADSNTRHTSPQARDFGK